MLDFEEKKYIKKLIYSRVSISIFLILLVLVMKGSWSAYKDEQFTRINKEIAERELDELKAREKLLASQINSLGTAEGRERELRNKFSVAKEGEKIIMIVDSKEDYNYNNTQENSFWRSFLNFFKK